VLGFLVDRRQEDDRDARGLRPLPDQRGRLVAVHLRHEYIEQDDREVVVEQLAQRQPARRRGDHLGDRLEHFGQRQQVALVVVDQQDPRTRRHLRPGLRRGGHGGQGTRCLHQAAVCTGAAW
jgi:hypothetical protein